MLGLNDHVDFDLHDRVEELKDQGYFEDKPVEYGVAQQVISQGIDSLSPKQRVVWRKGIVPILNNPLNDEERLHQALKQDWKDGA